MISSVAFYFILFLFWFHYLIFMRFSFPVSYSAADTVVTGRGKALVPTDLSIGIPEGTYARIGTLDGMLCFNFFSFSISTYFYAM